MNYDAKLIRFGRTNLDKTKYLVKNIGILTVSNFTSKILIFLLVPLYTSILSTSEYGIYDIVYSTIQLLFPFLTLNVSDAVMRFLMDKEKKEKSVIVIGTRLLLISIMPITVFMIGCWKGGWIKPIIGLELYILLYAISFFSFQFFVQTAKGLEKIKDMGIAAVLSTLFFLLGNMIFLLMFKMGVKGFYLANIFSQFTPALYLFFRLKIWKHSFLYKVDKKLAYEMILYSLPLIVSIWGWWVNNAANKYIVSLFIGSSANGLLSVAYKIPSIISVLQSIFIQAWQISAIKEFGSENANCFYGRTFSFLNATTSILCSLLLILTKPIASIMYSNEFYNAWEYVPFLLIACVINSAAGFLGPILSAKKDSKSMAISALYGAIANIFLGVILVTTIGVQGACVATVISSTIIFYSRKKNVNSDIVINDYTKIIITWILLCVQASLEIYSPIWWIELIIILSLLIINHKMISLFFQKMIKIF